MHICCKSAALTRVRMHSALKLIHNFANRKSPFIAFDAHDIAFSFDFSDNRYTIQYIRVCFLYIALSKVFPEKQLHGDCQL